MKYFTLYLRVINNDKPFNEGVEEVQFSTTAADLQDAYNQAVAAADHPFDDIDVDILDYSSIEIEEFNTSVLDVMTNDLVVPF